MGIDAPVEAVWPWVAQVGQGRGGFYTYQLLENMVGCKITNTAKILPEHQNPAVGDEIYLHPTAPPMRVEVVDPPAALVLFGSPADIDTEESWGSVSAHSHGFELTWNGEPDTVVNYLQEPTDAGWKEESPSSGSIGYAEHIGTFGDWEVIVLDFEYGKFVTILNVSGIQYWPDS